MFGHVLFGIIFFLAGMYGAVGYKYNTKLLYKHRNLFTNKKYVPSKRDIKITQIGYIVGGTFSAVAGLGMIFGIIK